MKKISKKLTFPIIGFLIILLVLFIGQELISKAVYPVKYKDIVASASEEFKLEQSLIYSVIKAESNFNEDARSKTQAIGLMQIMPDTFVWLKEAFPSLPRANVNELDNPHINIMYGSCYLRFLLDKFECEQTAVAAYNAGPGVVGKWLSREDCSLDSKTLYNIPFGETEKYVERVFKAKQMYNELYFSGE